MATSQRVPGTQTHWDPVDINQLAGAVVELQGVANGGSLSPLTAFARKFAGGSERTRGLIDSPVMVPPGGRLQLKNAARGLITCNYDTEPVGFTALTPVTQTLYGGLIGLVAGDVVTGLVIARSTVAAGTPPTSIKATLYDLYAAPVATLAATSAELNASAIWTAGGVGYALAPFSAAYTVTRSGGFIATFLQDSAAAWGTTALQIGRAAGTGGQQVGINGGAPASIALAGQATPPTSFTPAAQGIAVWFGAY